MEQRAGVQREARTNIIECFSYVLGPFFEIMAAERLSLGPSVAVCLIAFIIAFFKILVGTAGWSN
jgi:hypothetical protein